MRLNALDEFVCIAEKCPEHCCGEWMIEIDSDVLAQWDKLPEEINNELLANIYQLENDPGNRKVLAKKDNGECYCLNSSGLCNLQSQYGESALPDTCKAYPRKSYRMSGDVIETAFLSCPEMARIVVHNEARNGLFKNEINVDAKLNVSFSAKDQIYFLLYKFIIELLELDKYTLTLKLSLICKVVGGLVDKLERVNYDVGQINSILVETTKKPKNQLYTLNNQLKNKRPYSDPKRFLAFWKANFNIYLERNINLNHVDFKQSTLYKLLQQDTIHDEKSACDLIIQQFSNAKTALNRQYDDAFYRYIRLTLINRGFPLFPYNDNQLLALASCIAPFSVVCLALAAGMENGKTIDLEMISETVWRVDRKLGHTNSIYEYVIEHEILMEPQEYYQYLACLFL